MAGIVHKHQCALLLHPVRETLLHQTIESFLELLFARLGHDDDLTLLKAEIAQTRLDYLQVLYNEWYILIPLHVLLLS